MYLVVHAWRERCRGSFVAIQCKNCGASLPNDDAKFCNVCGTLTPSHPFSPTSTFMPASGQEQNNAQVPNTRHFDNARPPMREQIAHPAQNTDRPAQRFVQDEPPSWMRHLDASTPLRDNLPREPKRITPSPELGTPISAPLPHPNSSMRELRVKVWQQEEPVSSPGLPEQNVPALPDDDMDNLPTRPLVAGPRNLPVPHNISPASLGPVLYNRVDELERIDTVHLAVQPSREGFGQAFAVSDQQTASLARSAMPQAAAQDHAPALSVAAVQAVPVPRAAQGQQLQQTPPPHASISTPTARRKRSRKPFVLIAGLLVILLLAGIGVWVGVTQPFSIPAVVQPQQNFINNQLAFSLQYPSGWNTHVDTGKAVVFFADTSNTAQFTIAVSPVNGKDAGQYVQQLAVQLKMTSIKSGISLSFGGASWQQVQGNMLFSGANYSETILATVHNNQLYTITQAAPQSTYTQEEQIVFSSMRASFKFV